MSSSGATSAALVVDGQTLKFALSCDLKKDFLQLCLQCRAVVCCRVTPSQKAEVSSISFQFASCLSARLGRILLYNPHEL